MKKQETLLLIDGNALVHRSYHALPPLSHQGEPTNAVYGFASVLLKAVRELKPDYVVATFDLPAPTFRHEEFAEYKAHRPKTPDDLVVQFAKVKEVVGAFGIPIFEKAGFEADDLIGTLAEQMKEKGVRCIIITGDLDTLQLVNDTTEVLTLKKGISDTILYNEKAVRERFGLAPGQMADFKGLKGDPSDNIPGVPGIGDKTASSLLAEYGSLEELFTHVDDVPERSRAKLKEFKDQALFSKSLATIRRDAPVTLDLAAARFGDYDKDAVEAAFKKFGFSSLIPRLPHRAPAGGEAKEAAPKASPAKKASAADAARLGKENLVAVALEENELVTTSPDGSVRRLALADARDLLAREHPGKLGHDLKRVVRAALEVGAPCAGLAFDTLIAAYLLSPGEREYPLHRVFLEQGVAEDAPAALFALKEKLEERLREEGLVKLFCEIEMPLISVLAGMEHAGIKMDVKKLEELSRELERELAGLQTSIHKLAGEEFNIDSPAQLSKILFDTLGIKKQGRMKRTKTGMVSTRAGELEQMRDAHPIIGEILRYRELAKLKSTYADALAEAVAPDGRVHTIFNQAGTATGRLSSSEPNLQNIPQRGPAAKAIRSAFVADERFTLLALDFSQIELRIIASLSEDDKMMQVFREGGDIHRATAAAVNHVAQDAVTPEMRSAAKALNFGILYGMGERAFAQAAGIDIPTARRFIEEYFKGFSGVAKFMETTRKNAEKHGYVQTLLGRKRWLPDMRSKNPMLRSAAERMAQNMPTQGLQADIVKIAMVRAHRDVIAKRPGDVRLLLQIHDELVFEVRDGIIQEVAREIRGIMETAFTLKVPIIVTAKTGRSLGALSEFDGA